MEERQVTVDAHTYLLPRPFMVIATQNPIELEGTYPLPEAQLDRFLMRVPMGYPGREAEAAILDAQGHPQSKVDDLRPVVSAAEVAAAVDSVNAVHVAPEVRDYILDLVAASRRHPDLVLGGSPRCSLSLQRASRALAASFGRAFVIPDDVKRVFAAVLEHRVLLSPDAALRGTSTADVVRAILGSVPVPGAAGA
jgi:MoxR-like ATPase